MASLPPAPFAPMTEATHYARGYCCGNQCRHCPFEYDAVEGYPTPATPLHLRRAVPADVRALVPLARQTFAAAYIAYQDDVAANFLPYLETAFTPAVFAKALADTTQAWWVAADVDGRPWGYAVAQETPGHEHGGVMLKRLYVRRQARGLGLGRALLGAAEAFAKTRGAGAVWLETYVGAPALESFYVPNGYARVGTDYWTLGTQRFEVAVMARAVLQASGLQDETPQGQ